MITGHLKKTTVTAALLLMAVSVLSANENTLRSSEDVVSETGSNPLPSLDGSEADDLDALLELADEDLGQVSRVNVTAPSLDIEVTTVSRKKSTVGRSPAAVFVITQDMIRRSGATSVPEALRMAPGVQVARISSINGRYRFEVLVDYTATSFRCRLMEEASIPHCLVE